MDSQPGQNRFWGHTGGRLMPQGLTGPSAPQLPGLLMWALVSAVPALGSEAELPSIQGPGQASCARKNCSSGLLWSLAVTWLQAVCAVCRLFNRDDPGRRGARPPGLWTGAPQCGQPGPGGCRPSILRSQGGGLCRAFPSNPMSIPVFPTAKSGSALEGPAPHFASPTPSCISAPPGHPRTSHGAV